MSPTIGEISNALGITEKAALKRAGKEKWPGILISVNGEEVRDFRTFLLPKDVQKKLKGGAKPKPKKKPRRKASKAKAQAKTKASKVKAQAKTPKAKAQVRASKPETKARESKLETSALPPAVIEEPAPSPAVIVEAEMAVETGTVIEAEMVVEPEIIAPVAPTETLPALVQRDLVVKKHPDRAIVNLPDHIKMVGLFRYNLVHKYRDFVDAATQGRMEASESFMFAYNGGYLLPGLYAKLGTVAESTIRSWDLKLRQSDDDYTILCDGRGGWRKHGTNRWQGRSLTQDEMDAFLTCYLDPRRPTVTLAYRAAKALLLKTKNLEIQVSEKTFRRFLQDYKKGHAGIICLAREGEKRWWDLYGGYISRDASLINPCECLVADGKVLNFTIIHPDTGRPVRMILILFYDWASGCPVGWQLMPTESTIAIHAAFRNAVVNIGRYPDVVYIDNGKAFKSKHFIKTDPDFEEFQGLYARVDTAVVTAWPYNGKAKVVERFFKTFQEQFECILPSYCGDSIATKPAWMNRNEKFHKTLHLARTNNWVPNVREATAIIEAYFKWYSHQPVDRLGGRRPVEVLAEGVGTGVPVAQLNWDFMWRFETKPTNKRVTRWKIEYEGDCLMNLDLKTPIMCLYDIMDMKQIHCYTKDGVYLGDVYPVKALHPIAAIAGDEFSLEQIQSKIKKHRKELRDAKKQLLSIGADPELADGLDALPFNQMAAITVEGAEVDGKPASGLKSKPEPVEEKLSEAEVIRLEDFMKKAEAEAASEADAPPCPVEKPEFWQSELEHYEWTFAVRYQHQYPLNDEDQAFMAYFEMTDEFKTNYQGRFDDLKTLYNYGT